MGLKLWVMARSVISYSLETPQTIEKTCKLSYSSPRALAWPDKENIRTQLNWMAQLSLIRVKHVVLPRAPQLLSFNGEDNATLWTKIHDYVTSLFWIRLFLLSEVSKISTEAHTILPPCKKCFWQRPRKSRNSISYFYCLMLSTVCLWTHGELFTWCSVPSETTFHYIWECNENAVVWATIA